MTEYAVDLGVQLVVAGVLTLLIMSLMDPPSQCPRCQAEARAAEAQEGGPR